MGLCFHRALPGTATHRMACGQLPMDAPLPATSGWCFHRPSRVLLLAPRGCPMGLEAVPSEESESCRHAHSLGASVMRDSLVTVATASAVRYCTDSHRMGPYGTAGRPQIPHASDLVHPESAGSPNCSGGEEQPKSERRGRDKTEIDRCSWQPPSHQGGCSSKGTAVKEANAAQAAVLQQSDYTSDMTTPPW